MNLRSLAGLYLVVLVGCVGQTVPPSPVQANLPGGTLTATQARFEYNLTRRALESLHPGYDRYTDRKTLDQAFDELAVTIAPGVAVATWYKALSLHLALIRCDHTKAELPKTLVTYRNQHPTYLPFRFRIFENRMYVITSPKLRPERLPRGTEILKIDGRPVAAMIAALKSVVPMDGFTGHVKDAELADSGEFIGSAFDHFWPFFYGWHPDRTLEVRPPNASVQVMRVPAVTISEFKELAPPFPRSVRNFVDGVRYRTLDASTGLLAVDTFVNYRKPVKPATLYDPVFAQMKKDGIEHLIIDIRNNGGGSTDAMLGLLDRLMLKPYRTMRWIRVRRIRFDDLLPHLSTWDPIAMNPPAELFVPKNGEYEVVPDNPLMPIQTRTPHPEAFAGQVSLLVGSRNVSGTTILATTLRQAKRVRIVGEPTGGSAEGPTAGIIYFLKLPYSGVTVRIPWMRQRLDIDDFTFGRGVDPDVPVTVGVNDVLADRDPVLAAARQPDE